MAKKPTLRERRKARRTGTEFPDAEHLDILDNPVAERQAAEVAVEEAIGRGLSKADAEQLYGMRS